MVERVLGDVVAAVDPVHDLQRAVRPSCVSLARASRKSMKADASSVKPSRSSACTENAASRTQV